VKKIKITITFLLLTILNSLLFAQNFFNTLSEEYLLEHPGYFLSDKDYHASFLRKQQWNGFNTTSAFTFQKSLSYDRINLGLVFINSNFSKSIKNNQLEIPISYQLNALKGKISFGLKTGIKQEAIDFNEFNSFDLQDPSFSNSSRVRVAFSSGLYYRDEKNELGLSLNDFTGNILSTSTTFSFLYGRRFNISPQFVLEPLLFARVINETPLNVELRTKLEYSDYGWISILGSFNSKVAFATGIYLKRVIPRVSQNIKISYAFSRWLNELSVLGNTHEISVNYNFRIKPKASNIKQEKSIDNPVFFE